MTDHYSAPLGGLDREVVRHVPEGGNWRDLPEDFPSKRVQQIRAGTKGGSRSTYYGRLSWGECAYTISTYFTRPGNGCFIHPSRDRLISVREAARLQSFPDSVRFSGPLRSRCQQIGNAVPPLLAHAIASVQPPGTVVDLFCGIGGLSLGFGWAGSDTVLGADHDGNAVEAFSINHPGTTALKADLSSPEGALRVCQEVRSGLRSRLSFLVGGPPCQGFSTAGKYVENDARNKLVWQYLRLASELQPEILLMENVPALLWGKSRHTLAEIRKELTKIGYHSAVAVLHSEAYGVPQRRRRLFILASGDPQRLKWPAPTHTVAGYSMKEWQPGCDGSGLDPVTVREAIGDLPGETDGGLDMDSPIAQEASTRYQRWARGDGGVPFSVGRALPASSGLMIEEDQPALDLVC